MERKPKIPFLTNEKSYKEMIRYFLKCKAEAYRSYNITEQFGSVRELSPTRNQITC